MFEKFTERANHVILLAQEEARDLGHEHIGSEHILLGLLREEEGLAAQVLQGAGLEATTVRELLPREKPLPASGQTPFTPRAKAVLVESLRQALQLSQNYISTEHILLALLEDQDSAAGTILKETGIDRDSLREEILMLFEEGGEEETYSPLATEDPEASPERGMRRRSLLEQYAICLTERARAESLDPVIGRERETERMIDILGRRTKNNPLLVGPPGVGKTAVVEGLAQQIVSEEASNAVNQLEIYSLDLASLVAGSRYRGEFEERLKKLMREVQSRKNVVIFVDEIHSLVGAGAAEGALDAASILKPMLARGEIRMIGATTDDEFRKNFERDSAMERRFQQIRVEEPSLEDSLEILRGIVDNYSNYHGVPVREEALEAAVSLSDRYIPDRQLPDKAIDLLDEAASRRRIRTDREGNQGAREKEIERVRAAKGAAIEAEDYERAAELRLEERMLREQPPSEEDAEPLDAGAIAEVVSIWTGIPVRNLSERESRRLVRMEEELRRRVIGQDTALSAVSRALRRSRAGISDAGRPSGSFLFLGPTGVGKTELARTLAEFLFQDRDALVRVDMSEYMEKHAVSRLLGAPPGYVGHGEGGQLTEAVRKRPYSIVLLDEVEKAHPEVFSVLLQVLEDGHLTDSEGRRVDFRNTIVIMTSNLGAEQIAKPHSFGFSDENKGWSDKEIDASVRSELRKAFRPEFLNRIDEVVVFSRLGEEELREVVDLLIGDVARRLAEQGLDIHLTPGAKKFLLEKGWDPALGARPLRRAIQKFVEDPVADSILDWGQEHFPAGTVVQIRKSRGQEGLEAQLLPGGKKVSSGAGVPKDAK